jgi:hypothetical protein
MYGFDEGELEIERLSHYASSLLYWSSHSRGAGYSKKTVSKRNLSALF